ncbi:MAG: hypothetical protein KDC87_12590 [Planctomycetes bacterium]|nr:hypothetical protein [Planctomycetota bacterium]MCB9889307.1 hypothetical protein [Planctomycetota bacterium]
MNKLSLVWCGVALATSLSAQVGPTEFAPIANDTTFSSTNLSSLGIFRAGATDKRITQISFTKTPSVDGPGQWTAALTVYDLSAAYGGSDTSSGQFVLMGQYDTNKTPPTFTPTKDANFMNNAFAAPCRTLMNEPRDGTCCTVDQAGGVYFAIRSATNVAYPYPVQVQTAAATPLLPTYCDSVPCFMDGTLGIIYADAVNRQIVFRELQLSWSGTTLTGAEAQKVQVLATTTQAPNSPTPIIDKAGNVQALLLGMGTSTDSDLYFLCGFNAADTPIKVYDTTKLLLRGGVCGGRFFAANEDNGNTAASVGRVCWMAGSTTPIGKKATITVGASNPQRPFTAAVTQIALSYRLNNGVTSGFPLPGFLGSYALNGTIAVIASAQADINEVGYYDVTVPNNTAYVGIRISVQGLTVVPGQLPALTNTATLAFKQ